jgi:hypothetical protein
MKPSIFVSYSHKDADFARQLVNDLKSRVGSVWFDEVSIRPGRYWDDEVEKGIRETDVLLSLLSPNLLDSKICKDEFDNADRLGKPVIPILITHCDNDKMWMRMARRQYIDFRSDYSLGIQRLFTGLAHLGDYEVPIGQKCLVCNSESESNAQYCPKCKSPYLPSRLGDIYSFSPQYLQKYLAFYQPRTAITNSGVDDLIAVAIVHLVIRAYDTAKLLLDRAIVLQPNHGYAWYLRAITEFQGKRPRLLTRTTALEIQTMLNKAVTNDMMLSHAFILLALLKEDFFENKGFRIDHPNIAECIDRANRGNLDVHELRAMLEMIPIPDGKLIQAIRNII